MIEKTDEMRTAFAEAAGWPPRPWMFGPDVERGIAAVLALVERDYVTERRCPHGSGRNCGPCSFDAAIPRNPR